MSTKTCFKVRPGKGALTPAIRHQLEELLGDRVAFDVALAPLLAYGVGGPADALVSPQSEQDLQALGLLCNEADLPVTVIGNGTNLLVLDAGIRGIVVRLHNAFCEIQRLGETHRVRCGGGVSKPQLLEWAVHHGFGGLEFSAGVPGTLGGGIFMNAGTKYGCYADILEELTVFDFEKGLRTLQRKDLYFGYREQTAVTSAIVVSMVFALHPADPGAMRNEVNRIIQERAEKQPLDYPSCGSTFKNPPEGPSAGRLIERAGLKGTRVGGAEVSLKHANFILNKSNAKARDILALIDIIKQKVHAQFQVQLECEVIVLGEAHREQTGQI